MLFAISGASGLIYQVVWVRVFGNVFGNTIYSASLVVAIFMLGLGLGSYAIGAWADRRYLARPQSLLYAYGYAEIAIGLMGLGISAVLPHLGQLSAAVSFYTRDGGGYSLSTTSYLLRGAIAILLLFPITLLMGGTLTLLIRQLVRRNLGMWRISFLYAANTAGAALGCFLTDFALVPIAGLGAAQWTAVLLNFVAAAGALLLARYMPRGSDGGIPTSVAARRADARAALPSPQQTRTVVLTGLALAFSGFAAMGMEIVWFRHFTLMLGGLRSVSITPADRDSDWHWPGSTGGRIPAPSHATSGTMAHRDTGTVRRRGALRVDRRRRTRSCQRRRGGRTNTQREVRVRTVAGRLWFNARPIVLEVGLPTLLIEIAFPLANAVVQEVRAVRRPPGRGSLPLEYDRRRLRRACRRLSAVALARPPGCRRRTRHCRMGSDGTALSGEAPGRATADRSRDDAGADRDISGRRHSPLVVAAVAKHYLMSRAFRPTPRSG